MRALLDCLQGGHPLDEFLDHFPTVTREEAVAVIALATQALLTRTPAASGELLRLAAAAGFEVFLTVDRGIEFQHQVPALGLAVVALRARSNDVNDLRPLMAAARDAIAVARPGTIARVPA